MKQWGLSRGGALLAVLALLVSAGVFLPLGAQAEGKVVWGVVTDCATTDSVGGQITLVDVHGQFPDQTLPLDPATGFFKFQPQPGYYKLVVNPSGFTHFTTETAPFRFDGTVNVEKDPCVDAMPAKNRVLTLTVVDAAANQANETVSFAQFPRGPENVTVPPVAYNYVTDFVTLRTAPLAWATETLQFTDAATPIGGIPLVRGTDYDYTAQDAFGGKIHILNGTVQVELENTLFNRAGRGWLEVTYQNASTSSRLSHGQISSASFWKNGNPLVPYNNTLNLTLQNGNVQITAQDWRFGTLGDTLTASYFWSGAISGAMVTVHYPLRNGQAVSAPLTTDQSGRVLAQVWDGTFDVEVEASTYQPTVRTYTITGDTTRQIDLNKGWKVTALVVDSDIRPVLASDGLTGVLINNNPATNAAIRILTGTASANQLQFFAYNGAWTLIVDANGKTASVRTVTVSNSNQRVPNIILQNSPQELYRTEIVPKGSNDWGNLTIFRNATLLPDSVFPGIGYTSLHSLNWQLDLKFGDGNGAFNDGDSGLTRLNAYLVSAGPFNTVSNNFLTVNGKTYISVNGSYQATAVYLNSTTNMTVTTRANYQLSDTTKPIAANQPRYYVNITTIADQNVTVYQNNSYLVKLPKGYEMTSKTSTGNIVTRKFTPVEVDPSVDTVVQNPRVNMVIEKSLTGIARAEVVGPPGKISVQKSDPSAYLAWVANDTAIVFSANTTTDRENQAINVKDANFTWTFKQENATPAPTAWGIWTAHNFLNFGDWYIVNLTVRQVNPDNVTWREIKVIVDNVAPVATLKTNRTDLNANPPSLTVNEDQSTRFTGGDSTDVLYSGSPDAGKVAEWSWDFDSDGKIDRRGASISWNYSTPGTFTLTLIVTDSVGHKSLNRTMQVVAKDVTPPAIDFVILDPTNSWRETSQLVEGHTYWFNASKTTDNSLKHAWDNVNLSYSFAWGDGSPLTGPSSGTNASLNVTHTYARFGTNYKLNITATDPTDNHGYLNRTIVVQANTTAHPDLSILPNTLVITPTNPEESSQVKFSVNFTNAKGKADATSLNLQFALVVSGKDQNQTVTGVRWLDKDGNVITTLAAGQNGTVEFFWTTPSVGNKSLKIKVWDTNEPPAWVTSANERTTSLVVKEAGWKFWAIVIGFLFVVFGIPIIYYVVRKFRAGEWSLRREKREKEEDEEEEEEEEDEDEPKKKRL